MLRLGTSPQVHSLAIEVGRSDRRRSGPSGEAWLHRRPSIAESLLLDRLRQVVVGAELLLRVWRQLIAFLLHELFLLRLLAQDLLSVEALGRD